MNRRIPLIRVILFLIEREILTAYTPVHVFSLYLYLYLYLYLHIFRKKALRSKNFFLVSLIERIAGNISNNYSFDTSNCVTASRGIVYYDGTGRRERFKVKDKPGTYLAPKGWFAELKRTEDGAFRLVYPEGIIEFFDTVGRLIKI
jgi:hypothetical protein